MRSAYKQEGCTVSVEVDDVQEQDIVAVEIHHEAYLKR